MRAFTTTRILGSLSTASDEPAATVFARWDQLLAEAAPLQHRLATSKQVHGAHVLVHTAAWRGWLRADSADGHIAPERGTALAVSVADCVPVFIAHPSGVVALLHAGWRGTAAGILTRGVAALADLRFKARDLRVHFGPSICGECYEVGRDVHFAVSGRSVPDRANLDLRAELARKARDSGIREISISEWCTKHHNDLFFSHRAGDAGRQFAVIVADSD